jgi:D-amino-acid oxidase
MERIAVVGSGVIGLSVACKLAECESQNIQVTIISGQSPNETTSAVAAAYWAPYWIGAYNRSWGADTLQQLQLMAQSSDQTNGLTFCEFREWLDDAEREELMAVLEETYWWRNLPGVDYELKSLDKPAELELPKLGKFSFTSEVRFQSVVARMPDYLAYLSKCALDSGRVTIEKRWIDELEPLLHSFDRVVNCTGWGAKKLVASDPETAAMQLLAGHVVRVATNLLPHALLLHRGPFKDRPLYIVPRHGSVDDAICGGTAIEIHGEIDPRKPFTFPVSETCDEIHELCAAFSKEVAQANRCENLVGLRPVRSSLRIEIDPTHKRLVHCYGHGGSGLTLSWGSANEVMKLILANETAADL